MNKKFLTLAAAALVVGGFSSCNKTVTYSSEAGDGETGALNLSFSFSNLSTKTGYSDTYKLPTTNLSEIENAYFIITNANGEVVHHTNVSAYFNETGTTATSKSFQLSGISVGTGLTGHLVANYAVNSNSTTQAATYGYGGLPGSLWNPSNSSFSLDIKDVSSDVDLSFATEPTYIRDLAPNYFVGSTASTFDIEKNTTTENVAISLGRAVNFLRARVNQTPDEGYSQNTTEYISFNETGAALVIRRVQSSYNVLTGKYSNDGSASTTMSYSGGAFSSTEPSTGYSNGTTSVIDDTYKIYKDMLIFPPQTDSGDEDSDDNLLNVLLVGVTVKDGYVPNGSTEGVDQGSKIYWTANVKSTDIQDVGNKAIILNLDLKSAGNYTDDDETIPNPGSTGNIEVSVSLVDWTAVVEETLDM